MAKKGNKYKLGAEYYKERDLVPVVAYVPRKTHKKLKLRADKEARSLQKCIRLILEREAD